MDQEEPVETPATSGSSTSLAAQNNISFVLEDEDDEFLCGKCKISFRSLSMFMDHKRRSCPSSTFQRQEPSNLDNPEIENAHDNSYRHVQPVILTSAQYSNCPKHGESECDCNESIMTKTIRIHQLSAGDYPYQKHQYITTPPILLSGDEQLAFRIDQPGSITLLGEDSSTLTSLLNSGENIQFTTNTDPPQNIILMSTATSTINSKDSDQHLISHDHDENDIETATEYNQPDSQMSSPNLRHSSPSKAAKIPAPSENKAKSKKKKAEAHNNIKKCEFCQKTFKKAFNLETHRRSHTGEKPFHCLAISEGVCIVCGKGFTQKSNVKKHLSTHKVWTKARSTLPKEQISISVDDTLLSEEQTHRISESNLNSQDVKILVNNVYVCNYCESSFQSYQKLKSHMNIHRKEKKFRCTIKECSATFPEPEELIHHLKVHESEIEYKCHDCNKPFKTLYELGLHTPQHRLYPNRNKSCKKLYNCSTCGAKFASQESLDNHSASTTHHFPCSQCNLVFITERYLRRHLKIHTTEVKYVCEHPNCNRSFKTEVYLKAHKVMHEEIKKWVCDVCNLAFNRKDKLNRHKLIHDDNKKNFKCPFVKINGCTREFYRRDKLKDHIISHNKKVYLCTKCNKIFQNQNKLRTHQISYHPEMHESTTCEICNRIFKTKYHLKIHVCKPSASKDKLEECEDDEEVFEDEEEDDEEEDLFNSDECHIKKGPSVVDGQDEMLGGRMGDDQVDDDEMLRYSRESGRNTEELVNIEMSFENVDTPMELI